MYVHESGVPGSTAIVLIHGAGQSGRIWREHMARLSTFHCLAPDLPGFGQSNHLPPTSFRETADLVAALIETRVPARRAHVVGVSSGGAVVHALLDRHTDLVDRAVVDGSPPYLGSRGAGLLMALFLTALSPFIHTRPVMDRMGALWWDPADLRVASRRAFRRTVAECFRTGAAVGAPNPILLVAGENETGLSRAAVRTANAALATLMLRAEARFAHGLDHCWLSVAPDLHIRMVESWFTGQELPPELRPEPEPTAAAVEHMRRKVSAIRHGERYST